MKLLFIIIFFVNTLNAAPLVSVTYYIDNAGSDAAAGTSTGTAWQTIAKINSVTFSPGDHILFKKGGVWNETLIPPSSGTALAPIVFGSYGTGADPIITGFVAVTGMTNVGNVWSKTIVGGLTTLNTVMVNGIIRTKARHPNTGYLELQSGTVDQITTQLTGTPDYTGAQVVVRSAHFMTDVATISSQSTGVLNLANNPDIGHALHYAPATLGTNGFFIQNYDGALDVEGEWTYNSGTGVLKVYSATSPTVKISDLDFTLYANAKNYLTFDGIDFEGANSAGVRLDTCNFATVKNCSVSNMGQYGIVYLGSHNGIIRSDSITDCMSDAIYLLSGQVLSRGSDSAHIDSNYINNVGIYPGMATAGFIKCTGIYSTGIDNVITHNRIDSCGYNGIMALGKRTMIKNNYLTNFNFVQDDGAGIYQGVGSFYPIDYNDGTIIRSNIVMNGLGNLSGFISGPLAACIYLDDYERNVIVDSNLIVNGKFYGMLLNQADSNIIHNNNILNSIGNGVGFTGTDAVSRIQNFKYNVVVEGSPFYSSFVRLSGSTFTGIDSNYFSKPIDSTAMFLYGAANYSLGTWQTITGMDLHSTITIPLILSALPKAVFNATTSTVTQDLDGSYYDARGNTYTNSIILRPYQSELLFKNYPNYTNGGRIR